MNDDKRTIAKKIRDPIAKHKDDIKFELDQLNMGIKLIKNNNFGNDQISDLNMQFLANKSKELRELLFKYGIKGNNKYFTVHDHVIT